MKIQMKIQIQYLFCLIFLLGQLNLGGQIFICEPVLLRDSKLTASFKKYDMVKIPFAEISSYVKGRANGAFITLELAGERHEWKIYENNLLSPDFKAQRIEINGDLTSIDFDKSCRTYVGYRDDSGQEARFTITERTFNAMMPDEEKILYIQQASDFNKSLTKDLFVVYYAGDEVDDSNQSCSVKSRKHEFAPEEPEQAPRVSKKPRSYNCLELEVTMVADWSMEDIFDSTEAILDFNLTVLNHVEHRFLNDFDLDFWVQDFIVNGNYPSPWGEEEDVNELLGDFGDWAYAQFDTEDIGHLWTASNLHDDGDYGTIGFASVGGACSDIGLYPWCLLERFTPTISSLANLQAHEYGHLLDADHEPGTGTIMEPNLNDINCICWAQANIVEMWDFIEDEACIETCVQCPLSLNIIDRIAWGDWKYSSLAFTTSKAYIYHEADIIFQSEGYVKLQPGFFATSLNPTSGGATMIARIDPCE